MMVKSNIKNQIKLNFKGWNWKKIAIERMRTKSNIKIKIN
jgi:hypothetical protein